MVIYVIALAVSGAHTVLKVLTASGGERVASNYSQLLPLGEKKKNVEMRSYPRGSDPVCLGASETVRCFRCPWQG